MASARSKGASEPEFIRLPMSYHGRPSRTTVDKINSQAQGAGRQHPAFAKFDRAQCGRTGCSAGAVRELYSARAKAVCYQVEHALCLVTLFGGAGHGQDSCEDRADVSRIDIAAEVACSCA